MKLFEILKSSTRSPEFLKNSVLRDNRGIALVMVLILSLISLAIMSGLIYMATSGTQVSGIEKRYRTALEAGKGGRDIIYQVMGARQNPFSAAEAALFNFNVTAPGNCLTQKLNNPTNNWVGCDNTLNINPAVPATYDMSFQLGINPAYTVLAKIVDTVEGNSGVDDGLIKSGVVASNTGEVPVMSIAYLYTIEIEAENVANPTMEQAKLSVLYQY
ncbi:MAG: pilus assembly protein PilX [Nitrospiraceae bacterium]|nr:MAG: pilus assembly protein PilX [Nitrospiraceae bacterium]